MIPKATGPSGRSASPERRAVGQPAPVALQAYFRRIGRVRLLTREEEVSIAKRIEAGERAFLQIVLPERMRRSAAARRKGSAPLRPRRAGGDP